MKKNLSNLKPLNSLWLSGCMSMVLLACSPGSQKGIKESPGHPESSVQPNIVWITCEDIGPDLPMYGDSTISTPNLDKLASEGIVFDNAYSVSGVCSPSRSALITGMYPASIGTHNHRSQIHTHEEIPIYEVVPPDYVKCFTEYLRAEGYYCTNNYKCDYNFGGGIMKPPYTAFDVNRWDASWKTRKPGQPFFSIFNLQITHMSKLYKREQEPLRVNPDYVPVPPYFPDTPKARTSIARYYDNIMIMDEQVGEILHDLEADGLLENTIIFFFSDHGNGFPRNKIWLYDSGIKVPFMIRFPGGRMADTRSNDLISFVDFAPTVLKLAGIDIPHHFQGIPFPLVGDANREYIFAAKDRIDFHYDRIRAVRNKNFKYIRNYYPEKPYRQYFPWSDSIALTQEWTRLHKDGSLNDIQELFFQETRPEEELYDVLADPYEINNLASVPEYAHILEKLSEKNNEHIEETGDLGFTDEKVLMEKWWPGGIQPITEKPEGDLSSDSLILSCRTQGASIAYKINGNEDNWNLYIRPIAVNEHDTVEARAIRYGFKPSESTVFNH